MTKAHVKGPIKGADLKEDIKTLADA